MPYLVWFFSGLIVIVLQLVSMQALAEGEESSIASTSEQQLKSEDQTGDGRTPEEIFQAVFGRKMAVLPAADYPVILDNRNIGDILAKPSITAKETQLESSELKQLLLPYLTEAKLQELDNLISQRKFISMADLLLIGVNAQFDSSTQAVNLSIPLGIRSEFPVSVFRRTDPSFGIDYLSESKFSAIANVYASTNAAPKSEIFDENRSRNNVSIENAVRWNDVVFETGINFSSDAEEKLTYRNTRLIKDLVDDRIRLQAGDVDVSNRALQTDVDMFGLSISRYFGTKPYKSVRPNPSRSFTIQGDARVSIFINNRLVQEIRLSAGRYNLQDLPLRSASGNDIRLLVNYDNGETEQFLFDAFYDFNLLSQGTSEFDVSLGVRNRIVNGVRDYQKDRPILSAFYRKGFLDTLSLGVNSQAQNDYVNVGFEGLLTTGLGSFGVFSSTSLNNSNTGSAFSLFYRLNHFVRNGVVSLNLQNDSVSSGYRSIADVNSQLDYTNQLTGRVSFDHSSGVSLSTTYETRILSLDDTDEASISSSITYNSRLGSVSLSGRLDENRDGRESFWGISYSTGFDAGSASFTYQSNDPSYRIGFAAPPKTGAYSVGYDVSHTRRDESDQSRLGLTYLGNRVDSRLELNVADGQQSEQYANEVNSTLFVGTALVYADGVTAVSRPVSDSFAIFSPNRGAEKFKLGVDPQSSFWTDNNRYHAWSDALGPPVINNLNSYYLRHVTVDAPFAPAGTSIGTQAYSIIPGYRGGLMIGVGSDENAALIGTLVDENNNPVPFAVGYTLDDDGEKNSFFSNAGGRFYVASLRAGTTVELVFTYPIPIKVNIDIPDNTVGIYRLDDPIGLPFTQVLTDEKGE